MLLAGVNDEDSGRQALHGLDTAQILLQVVHFLLELCHFLLGKHIESAVLLHLFQSVQTVDALTDGLVVGQHTAEPTNVYEIHTAALSLFANRISCLLLGANEQNGAALSSNVADVHVRLFKLLDGLLQVDDVDAVTLGEDVLSHLGVPASGVVTEMYTGFQKLLNAYNCHDFILLTVIFRHAKASELQAVGPVNFLFTAQHRQAPSQACVCYAHICACSSILPHYRI